MCATTRLSAADLVLRADVLRAIEGGRFHIHAIDDVDDALELLTGRPAGVRDGNGAFPPGRVNASVERRLFAFAESAREFGTRPRSAD
jgi:hypothetical protein